jgi:hypothetical protein
MQYQQGGDVDMTLTSPLSAGANNHLRSRPLRSTLLQGAQHALAAMPEQLATPSATAQSTTRLLLTP